MTTRPIESEFFMPHPQDIDWTLILGKAGPYPLEAFEFVREALSYTCSRVHENVKDLEEDQRHISPRQLCDGLRDYALEKYGLLAPSVLEHWHIHRTEDFGRMVFAMIDGGLMSKTDSDTLEDFQGVYTFADAFGSERLLDRLHAKSGPS